MIALVTPVTVESRLDYINGSSSIENTLSRATDSHRGAAAESHATSEEQGCTNTHSRDTTGAQFDKGRARPPHVSGCCCVGDERGVV